MSSLGEMRGDPLSRTAGRALVLSGVAGVVGVVCLLGMLAGFASGQRELGYAAGTINDVSAIVVYPLAVPAMLAFRPMLRAVLGVGGDVVTLVGLGAVASIVALQLLLVAGGLPFERQIGPVTIAFLLLGAYFVALSVVGRSRSLPVGVPLAVGAGLYFGYPIWAVRLGRYLAAPAG